MISSYIQLDNWYLCPSKTCQYRIAHLFCIKYKPFQTLIFLKHCSKSRMTYKRAALVWLLQGARRREFRYIYKPRNPSRTRGRAYLLHLFYISLTTTRNFNEIERIILLIMIICETQLFCFYLFQFWELKSTKAGIGALNHIIIKHTVYGSLFK